MPDDTPKPKPKPWKVTHKISFWEGQSTHYEIGLIQQKLIGRLTVEWTRLEFCIHDLVWRMLNLKFEDGRVVTDRMDAVRVIAIARVLAPRYLQDPVLKSVLEALIRADELRDDRNFIIHGTWCTVFPDGIAWSSSLRKKSEPGEVTAEEFPHSRMYKILREIGRVKGVIVSAYKALPYPYPDR